MKKVLSLSASFSKVDSSPKVNVSNKGMSTLFKMLMMLVGAFVISAKSDAQILLNEQFNNLTNVNYAVGIPTTGFDVPGWQVSSANKISIAEAGSVCIGRSGNGGADLSTPPLDLSGTDIKILSFKLKYYGTNGITGSTSSKVLVNFDATNVFNGVKGVVSIPVSAPNYTQTDWTSYSIVLTGGTAISTITFMGTSSNYAYMIDDVVVLKSPAPSVTTTPASAISFTDATVGGNITATAIPITASGVCWSTTNPNPTVANNVSATSPLVNSGNFSLPLAGLPVSTTIYYNTYVTTSVGVFYGTPSSFLTLTPVYQLVSSPNALDFGAVSIGTSSILSYTLTTNALNDGPGVITVTAPANFTLSTSLAGPYTSTLSLNYTGTSLPPQTIYVSFNPTAYIPYSGIVTLSGGGAGAINTVNCTVTGRGKLATPSVTSNLGNDFWLGFGYQEKMNQKAGNSSEARMSVYVTTGNQPATVHCDLLSGGYNQVVTIPANSFYEFNGFPTGDPANNTNIAGLPDARLYKTGKSNKSVHVFSEDGSLIGVFLHTYTNSNSAGGAMIFPDNTWNTSYTVQAYGAQSNNANPNSFFFVIANEDNTIVTFTPTQPILDTSAASLFTQTTTTGANTLYNAGSTYTVTLNRGEVFNAMGGFGPSSTGLDLSGTKITTNCKKVAVFGGNGRCFVNPNGCNASSGSDNLIQQMFPSVAWGTKYLTNPTKTQLSNYYRIYVQDPLTTSVWVNNPAHTSPLTGIVNNLYYEYISDQPLLIEGSKAISVTQFVTTPSCNTPDVNGGPEMIILSPVQQSIPKSIVYSSPFKTSGANPAIADGSIGNCGSYINVVIPTTGVATFKLDGLSVADTGVATTACALTGNGNCASFSASTLLLPMSQVFIPHPQDPGYSIAKIWVTTGVSHTLESDVPFNAIAYGFGVGESYGFNAGALVKDLTVPLIIQNPYGGPVNSANTQTLTTCMANDFKISAVLPYETNYIKFSFRNNPNIVPNTDTVLTAIQGNIPYTSTYVSNGTTYYVYALSTPYHFTALGDYPVDITSFNTTVDGTCASGSYKTTSYTIHVVDGVAANFSIAYNTCINDSVHLTDLSNGLGYNITKWNWSYNNGANPLPVPLDTVQNPALPNPANNTAGNFTLEAINSIGCFQKVTKELPIIPALPPVTLNAFASVCTNTTPFALSGGAPVTVSGVGTGVYSGPGVNSVTGIFSPSVAGVGTHTIKYVYTNSYGCKDSATKTIVVNQALTLTITPVAPLCSLAIVALQANNPGGVFAGPGVSGTNFDPSVAGVGTHTITYSIASNPCAISASTTITVNPQATANFATLTGVCNTTPAFTLTGGTPVTVAGTGTGVYSGTGVNSTTGVFTPSTAGVGTFPITYTYTTQAGCVKTAIQNMVVSQAAVLSIGQAGPLCINDGPVNLTNSLSGGIFSGSGVTSGGLFDPSEAGVGTHTITYSIPTNNCTVPASIQIVVNPAPTDVNAGASLTTVQGSPIQLAGSSTAGSYVWTPSTGLSNPGILNPVATPRETITYTLTGTNSFGCSANDSMILTVLIPCLDPAKVFTPNNDGNYDRWVVFNGGCIKGAIVDVYNRWGSVVYHSGNYQNNWDGTYENKPLPDGTYYYIVRAVEISGRQLTVKGNVTIMR